MKPPAVLAPLRHRPFRLLWSGQVVSDVGDWLDFLALITLIVYRWNLGPAALAALSVAVALPRILAAPVAGVWVDRWPRKNVMVVSDLTRAVIVLGLVFAPNLPILLGLVFVKAGVSTFFGPAKQAMIRSTVPEDDLLAANSVSQLSTQSSKIFGPVLGGIVVGLAGPRAALAVDAVTFLISASFLIQLPRAQAKPEGPAEAPAGFWKEAGEGLKFTFRSRPLVIAIASMSAAAFMIFIIDSLGVLALKALGVNEALFGLAVGAIGLGTTLGALAVGQWGKRFNPLGIMGSGQALSGAMVAVLGGAVLLNLRGTGFEWALLYMVTGFAAAAVFVPYAYVLQINTPQQMLGRVFATADALETVFQLVAPPVGAALSQIWGVGWVFGIAGAALAVVGLVVFGIGPRLSGQPAGAAPPGALEGKAPS